MAVSIRCGIVGSSPLGADLKTLERPIEAAHLREVVQSGRRRSAETELEENSKQDSSAKPTAVDDFLYERVQIRLAW